MSPFPIDLTPPSFDDPSQLRPSLENQTTIYRDVRYAIEPGFRPLYLDLAVPSSDAPVPLVIYIHGGAWMMGDNRPEPVGDLDFRATLERFVREGFAVASVQYRLSSEALFPACLHDVKAAVRYLRAFSHKFGLDPERIFSFGDSAGGHLSAFLATSGRASNLEGSKGVTSNSSEVAAAVAWYPVTSINHLNAQSRHDAYIDRTQGDGPESLLLGVDVNQHPGLAAAASPISYVAPESSPILLIHGDSDRIVPHEQSLVLEEAYHTAGADVELLIVPNADHCFFDAKIPPLLDRTVAFLRKHAYGSTEQAP